MRWGIRGKASVLVGGQFGSEGKGGIAAFLAESGVNINVATTNAGAQAGHTTRYKSGDKFVCFHLPTSGVVQQDSGCASYINAGSIIDIEAFQKELIDCDMTDAVVWVHPNAAVITPEDKAAERAAGSSTEKTSSTQKGVGMAISGKVMRRGKTAKDYPELNQYIQNLDLNHVLHQGYSSVVVEVPQGTGLSINHSGFYPYTTSRDCWVGSGLQDAGIHPDYLGPVCMVVRTFPIRVGNLINEMGEQIGTSGPFFSDSFEMDWEDDFPGIEPERTTVTKRVRRIASWSNLQYLHALRLNRPTIVALTFCDYFKDVEEFIQRVKLMWDLESRASLACEHLYAFGPCVEDVTASFEAACNWFKNRSL